MNHRTLQGWIALITGGGRGIGRAIASGLAREGASVAVTARSRDEIDSVVEQIHRSGGTALAMRADRSAPEEAKKLGALTVKAFGTVDSWSTMPVSEVLQVLARLRVAAPRSSVLLSIQW